MKIGFTIGTKLNVCVQHSGLNGPLRVHMPLEYLLDHNALLINLATTSTIFLFTTLHTFCKFAHSYTKTLTINKFR